MDNDAMERKFRDMYSSGDVQELSQPALRARIGGHGPGVATVRRADPRPRQHRRREPAATRERPARHPSLTLRRIVKPGQAWIVEGTIDYGDGTPVSLVSILETDADGKITRATDYFANPFEAPEWRRKWVEQMDPARGGLTRPTMSWTGAV